VASVTKNVRYLLAAMLALALAGSFSSAAYGQKKPKIIKQKKTTTDQQKNDTDSSAEPDKVLYERAMQDIKKTKYIDARLALQTLINTYPDSEYLAKAKLATADSFFKEGGTSNLTQSIEEYKNFIVFFPFLDEAAYAQMQIGMAHYKMMEKSDRDSSQAESAEDEFQTFLLHYPQSPLVPKAEQYLRNVQEVLADGEFRIARFYYTKPDYRASAARLVEVTSRYPLYSQSDEALSMLGNVYIRARQISPNEDDKNHWSDLAIQCYSRLLRDYPLSKFAPEAKAQLKAMNAPVPAGDPNAVARMEKQQEFEKHHHPNALLDLPVGIFRSSPPVYTAARWGAPNLNPPDDSVSATEVLKQGAAGPTFGVFAASTAGGSSAAVETESTDSSSPPAGGDTTAAGVQVLNAPTAVSSIEAPAATTTAPDTAPPAANPQDQAAGTQASQPTSGNAPQTSSQQASDKADSSTESSSKKKKKGLHKIIPF